LDPVLAFRGVHYCFHRRLGGAGVARRRFGGTLASADPFILGGHFDGFADRRFEDFLAGKSLDG